MDGLKKKIVCVDLDGTIARYDEWVSEEHFGEVISGTQEGLTKLKKNGWIIIIYTTRSNTNLIRNYLENNEIPFDYINENPYQPENAKGGKLYAQVYVDDKAIQFQGDWNATINQIMEFKNWQVKGDISLNQFHIDFLKGDFDQSYQQLRHYDSLNWDITKFSFIQLLLSISAIWALYSFSQDSNNTDSFIANNFNLIVPTIIGGSYLFSLLASFLISRNRVYFAKTARYLNEHRGFSLSNAPLGFQNITGFYTNTNFPPAFDIWSTHLVSLYVIQLVSSVYFGVMSYYILANRKLVENCQLEISVFLGLLAMTGALIGFIRYLKKQDKKFGK